MTQSLNFLVMEMMEIPKEMIDNIIEHYYALCIFVSINLCNLIRRETEAQRLSNIISQSPVSTVLDVENHCEAAGDFHCIAPMYYKGVLLF